ncbi:hypothetical protein GCWU000324_00441 [Kingella oralis ATCC 51147]|uniref:Uncharacterized protein n=1 Tax=Kingella oralis ATCC 51147 TaxID=629741 RepID=C4GHV3_9NEIS|nr:hypothetical protein GCWU000324_00441 [Kingella oralis ATCC 51147]
MNEGSLKTVFPVFRLPLAHPIPFNPPPSSAVFRYNSALFSKKSCH